MAPELSQGLQEYVVQLRTTLQGALDGLGRAAREFPRPLWKVKQGPDLSEAQARAADAEDDPFSSDVEKHEKEDWRKTRQRQTHPILRVFGPATLVLEHPRVLSCFGGERIGPCVLGGPPVVFSYFLPAHRAVLDQLQPGDGVAEASRRERWCKDHGLRYFSALPGYQLDLAEVARRLGLIPVEEN